MKTHELFGKEVLDISANKIGTVADIDFDMHGGIINHIVVKAGIVKKYDVSLDKIDKIGEIIVLNIGKDKLKK